MSVDVLNHNHQTISYVDEKPLMHNSDFVMIDETHFRNVRVFQLRAFNVLYIRMIQLQYAHGVT